MGGNLNKKDHYIQIFMGTDYEIPHILEIKNVKGFKNFLEKIVENLPKDGQLKISEITAHNGEIGYTLEEAIPQ